jgi:hypothetical protein
VITMRIIITTTVLALTSTAAAAQRPPQVPVMITSDPAYTQPCSIGVVIGWTRTATASLP